MTAHFAHQDQAVHMLIDSELVYKPHAGRTLGLLGLTSFIALHAHILFKQFF